MRPVIRKAMIEDAQSIAEVRTKSWQSTYRGIVNDAYLDNFDITKITELWKQIITKNPCVYVVEMDRIIGFGSAGKNRHSHISADGEVYLLYLLKEYQGMGIGKMLFLELSKQLSSQSMRSMLVWVLKDNPSKPFYLHMGGKLIQEEEVEINGQKLKEEGYIWDDISNL